MAPLLLIVFAGSRWRWPRVAILVMIGAAESGFATTQSTHVLLSAHEDRRGGAQPLGTLWLGLLATGIGVAVAMALNRLLALAAIAPVAVALWRRGRGGWNERRRFSAREKRFDSAPALVR